MRKFIKVDSEFVPPEQAEIVMSGSIMEKLPDDWAGIMVGTGKLHESTQKSFPNATILAVRGPLSAKYLGRKNLVFADAALLADELVPKVDRIHELGIIPHWSDNKLEHTPIFKKYNPLIIRVKDDPIKVIEQISQCKKIVSSSLHGIILADAFQIPRRIEIAPWMYERPKQEGGIFKWFDYSASMGVKLEIGISQQLNMHKVLEKQYELYDVFKEVKTILKKGV